MKLRLQTNEYNLYEMPIMPRNNAETNTTAQTSCSESARVLVNDVYMLCFMKRKLLIFDL